MLGRTNTGGGGGGLNFKVVGNPKPTNPKENTIWIDTDVKITSYIFNATEPENHVPGVVWISTGTSSVVEFNALKKNGIQVYPVSAQQYINGSWQSVIAEVYQNGEWSAFSSLVEYILQDGAFAKGTWGSHKDSGKKVEFVDGQIHLEVDGNGSATFYTTEKFDVTGKTELVFVVQKITQTNTNMKGVLHFGIGDVQASHTYATEIFVDTVESDVSQEFIVPITPEYYGKHYIKASIIRATSYRDGMYISEIRLQ